VRNFRAFKELNLALDEMTVIIGENNTGKTSLLDAIRLCLSRPASRREALLEEYDFHLDRPDGDPNAVQLDIEVEFAESVAAEWPEDLVQQLADAVVIDGDGLRRIRLRLTSRYDAGTLDYRTEWEFLDAAGNSMGARGRRTQTIVALQQAAPIFYLTASRDASREFQARSAFWGPFLRNPSIPEEQRAILEAELGTLNEKVLDAEGRLKSVATHLGRTSELVDLGGGQSAKIEAIPLKIRDLLARAQVVIQGAAGISLPLARHGTGTQSLAVLFLFEAFLTTLATQTFGPHSSPILTLEEPEAHLHPSAVRSLWSTLDGLHGQKIVVTHSGDLMAAVPLTAIRRLFRSEKGIEVRQVVTGTFTADEERKINYHVRRSAGEMFFARCWLLGEGETEYWVFTESARVLGIDLDRSGVRILSGYSQVYPVPLIRLADALGIAWHCVTDGDEKGKEYYAAVQPHAQSGGRTETDYLTKLGFNHMEHLLCEGGFGYVYERMVSPQKRGAITAAAGQPEYWPQVIEALPKRSKQDAAIETMAEMSSKGKASVPPAIRDILEKSVRLAER